MADGEWTNGQMANAFSDEGEGRENPAGGAGGGQEPSESKQWLMMPGMATVQASVQASASVFCFQEYREYQE